MSEHEEGSAVGDLIVAANAWRNLGFGLIVGGIITAGVYYAYVLSPDEPLAYDATFYLALALVLGVSIAVLMGLVLSVATLIRRGVEGGH